MSTSDVATYFRQTVYLPLLDNVIMDIIQRFPSETLDIFQVFSLLTSNLVHASCTSGASLICSSLAIKYGSVTRMPPTNPEQAFRVEYDLWFAEWCREKECGACIPSTAIEAFGACDKDILPTIHTLLQVLVTLPISNATAERCFSTLPRLKMWIRSTMCEDRLLGLALLSSHRDIFVDVNSVIERFADGGKRRLLLPL